jgi:hypothetical protein
VLSLFGMTTGLGLLKLGVLRDVKQRALRAMDYAKAGAALRSFASSVTRFTQNMSHGQKSGVVGRNALVDGDV